MKRRSMSKRSSKRSFKRGASRTHKRNVVGSGASYAMRGGIRL